jgi:hypothetical protein
MYIIKRVTASCNWGVIGFIFFFLFSLNMSAPVFIKEGTPKQGLVQGITLNDWTITSKKASICNSYEMEK